MRDPLSIEDIEAICAEVHRIKPDCVCFVDNCYGEFVDTREPVQVGADIMAGSLIKNPGGGIALTGGYICGKDELVELASYRLTSPGLGDELGASLANNRMIFQGFFLGNVPAALVGFHSIVRHTSDSDTPVMEVIGTALFIGLTRTTARAG